MGAYTRVALRSSWVAFAVMCVIASGAGLVRLLPWLTSPEVPLRVAIPFARALAAVAIETSVVVGLPIGFGVAAAVVSDRGESRAMHALGASPFDVIGGAWWVALVLVGLAVGGSLAVDPGATVPGRLANELLEQGRRSCDQAQTARIAVVPMTGLAWLCTPGADPIVAGPVPRANGRLWWAARQVVLSNDLTGLTLERLELFSLPKGKVPPVRVRVGRARFSGMAAWGRPAGLSAQLRAFVVALTALVLAGSVGMALLLGGVRSRVFAACIGSVAAAVPLWLLHRVDTDRYAIWFVPLAGLGPLVVGVVWIRARLALLRVALGRRRQPTG